MAAISHWKPTMQSDYKNSEAMLRLRLAADQGNADAQYKLAGCFSYDYDNE
jgi:TPR repeat protein